MNQINSQGNKNQDISGNFLTRSTYQVFSLAKKESQFLIIILLLVSVAGILTPYPHIAMWFGFAIAGYSAIANDSIQTIGTFIASNLKRPWWALWLFMGLIFVFTVLYSWIEFNGDVSHQRLASKGFDKAPESFSFLQLAAPIVLLILTRLRMPVSTSILLLSVFSTSAPGVQKMLMKSFFGYGLSFVTAIIVWFLVTKFVDKHIKGKPAKYWIIFQWITSGSLWAIWIAQDAANIAVFLPRSLSTMEFLAFTGYIFIGLGLLFFLKGDRIQRIVTEKAGIQDIRAATLIDFVYALLLYYFKVISTIPISTTWVFIGLLGGRELAIAINKKMKARRQKALKTSYKLILKDVFYASIGLAVSVVLALLVNDNIRREIFNF